MNTTEHLHQLGQSIWLERRRQNHVLPYVLPESDTFAGNPDLVRAVAQLADRPPAASATTARIPA